MAWPFRAISRPAITSSGLRSLVGSLHAHSVLCCDHFLIKNGTQVSMKRMSPTLQTAFAAHNVSFPRTQSPRDILINTNGRLKSILLAPRLPWPVVDQQFRPRTSTSSEVTNTPTLVSPTACTWSPRRQPTQLSALLSGLVRTRIWWIGLKPFDGISWTISLCWWKHSI